MSLILYYVRHAQSNNNAAWNLTGSSQGRTEDPAISEIGQRQIINLVNHKIIFQNNREAISENGYCYSPRNTYIYCSPMIRSIQTGLPLANNLGIRLVMIKDLHECGGIYLDDERGHPVGLPGKTKSFFQKYYPQLIVKDEIPEGGWWDREFESLQERQVRASRLLYFLLNNHGRGTDRVILLGHAAFYNVFMSTLLGLDRSSNIYFRLNNTAITRIDFIEQSIEMVYQNSTGHIPVELIT
jgi:2,3-bisphosphoglycerate-dependent phosphoglycerate mutase